MHDREAHRALALFERHAVLEGADRVLGRAVGRLSAQRQERVHAADLDDVSAARRRHPVECGEYPGDRAEEVDLDRVAVLSERQRRGGPGMLVAHVQFAGKHALAEFGRERFGRLGPRLRRSGRFS